MAFTTRLKAHLIHAYLSSGPTYARSMQTVGRVFGRDPRQLTFYHQVDDPWSHLLAQVLPALVKAYDVNVHIHIVPPPTAASDPEPERRRTHARRDAALLASMYGLTLPVGTASVWPPPALTQRANALLTQIPKGAQGLSDILAIGHALWSGDEAALNTASTHAAAESDEAVMSLLDNAQRTLHKAGHYQGGMLHYGGLWYWGVDRLHYLERRMANDGLGSAPPLLTLADEPDLPMVHRTEERMPLDFFFSFRSPYSYLAVDRTLALAETFDLDLRIRPVLPMVMRGLAVPLAKRLYLVKDAKREADHLGIPFGHICDPLGVGVERCLAVWPLAESEGCLPQFLQSAGRGIWSEALDVASDADLRTVTERAGLVWDDVRNALTQTDWRARAEANRAALLALDMWGVPSFRLGDLSVWGQDRIDMLEHVLRTHAAATPIPTR